MKSTLKTQRIRKNLKLKCWIVQVEGQTNSGNTFDFGWIRRSHKPITHDEMRDFISEKLAEKGHDLKSFTFNIIEYPAYMFNKFYKK